MEKLKLPTTVKQAYLPQPPSNGHLYPSNGVLPKSHVTLFKGNPHTSLIIDNSNLNNINRRDSVLNGTFVA